MVVHLLVLKFSMTDGIYFAQQKAGWCWESKGYRTTSCSMLECWPPPLLKASSFMIFHSKIKRVGLDSEVSRSNILACLWTMSDHEILAWIHATTVFKLSDWLLKNLQPIKVFQTSKRWFYAGNFLNWALPWSRSYKEILTQNYAMIVFNQSEFLKISVAQIYAKYL